MNKKIIAGTSIFTAVAAVVAGVLFYKNKKDYFCRNY